MTPELQRNIEAMTVKQLLSTWRFAPGGDPRMQGESGAAYARQLAIKRSEDPEAYIRASKELGW